MSKAPDWLTETCRAILEEQDIEAFGDRALTWHIPPELLSEYMEPGMENRMFGYRVNMEALLGERTVMLTETLAMRQVPEPART